MNDLTKYLLIGLLVIAVLDKFKPKKTIMNIVYNYDVNDEFIKRTIYEAIDNKIKVIR